MPHPARRAALVLGAWLCAVCPRPAPAADDFAFYHENVMGTSLELRVRADGEASARRAEARVLGTIDRLAQVFSGYDPASEFRRWQAGPRGPVRVSPELYEVLETSDRWRAASGGAFDPRVEALTRLWSSCARLGREPTADELNAAKARTARDAWRLDPAARTAERLSDGPLTLNAIAKGYIVERACDAALDPEHGIRGILLNVGGDLRVRGETVQTIGIAPPRGHSEAAEPFTFLEARDRSVSTSGDAHRGLTINGRWYSHIFDPRTGRPVEKTVSATVVAPRGADADALATACNVLPVEDSLRLADALPDVACLLVTADGKVARSARWHLFERPRPAALDLALADAGQDAVKGKVVAGEAWGGEYELVINFEINRPAESPGRYRRPYIVVWAEDPSGVSVRTVVLWVSLGGQGPDRWLPDLARWYRDDKQRGLIAKKNMIFTIAQPTRQPGKYQVIWDGKDDRGKPVAKGVYTVSIEAAREHGTHQLIRKQVTLADRPFVQEFKGDVEIKSASYEYRRKGQGK